MRGYHDLLEAAKKAIKNAYAPYSGFRVASAVRAGSGKIYCGVNVENASYGLTICAERVAIFKAISEGEKEILEVLVYTETDEPVAPCGACRQVIAEFGRNARIIMASKSGKVIEATIEELLPYAFTKERLLGQRRLNT